MPSVRYYNQTAPFWDFIASMEEQGASHPLFAGNSRGATTNNADDSNNEPQQPTPNPWQGGWAGFPFGPMPHRGRHHGPPHHHHGPPPPPPPPGHEGPPPPPGHEGPPPPPSAAPEHDPAEGSSDPRGPPPPFSDEPEHRGPPHHGPHGSHRGRCGGRGGRGSGWGGRGRGGPWNWNNTQHPLANLSSLAELFQSQLLGGDNNNNPTTQSGNTNKDTTANAGDFTPDADVFDTATNYTIHLSLPGAAKSDIAVTWSEQTSSLTITGVVHRPGSEELLATLALDERQVGAFERSIRLGSRANPAQVDAEGITAKLEDGVLRVEVPKLDADYVEVRRVDVE